MGENFSEEERALLQKIAEAKKKKGGVDPTIVVYRDENQPIRIVVRAIKPPVITGDYVSVSVSDSDFLRIMRVFQQIQESGVPMRRSFETREGGRSYSSMEYYNSLEIVERFIQDIYGVEKFFRGELDPGFAAILPLKDIHTIVFRKWQQDPSILERGPHTDVFPLIDNIKWFSIEEFEQYILPFLEAAFFWELNKDLGLSTSEFRETVSARIRKGGQSALYGYLTEIYMSGLYIFRGWKNLHYTEKRGIPQSRGHCDWIFVIGSDENIGIECKDKRQTMRGRKQVKYADVRPLVTEAIKQCSTHQNLKRRMLWINITNIKDYSRPSLVDLGNIRWRGSKDILAGTLTPSFPLRNEDGEIDCMVLAWREKMEGDNGFDYIERYVVTEGADCSVYLPQRQPLIHVSPGKHFFVRTYVFPEPAVGTPGPVETAP